MPVLDMAAEFLNAVPASKKDHGIDKPDKNATDEAVRDEAERMAATGNLNATTAEISHQQQLALLTRKDFCPRHLELCKVVL